MSIQATYIGQPEHADTVSLSTTAVTAVLTGENTLKTCGGCSIINTSGSDVTVSLYRYDGAANQRFWRGVVAANDTRIVNTLPIPLHRSTEEIRAEASASGSIEVYPIILRQQENA